MRMTVDERHSLSSQVVSKSSQVIHGDVDTPKDCYEKNAIKFCCFFKKKKKTSIRYDFLKLLWLLQRESRGLFEDVWEEKKIKVLNFTYGKCVYISHVKTHLKVINIEIR